MKFQAGAKKIQLTSRNELSKVTIGEISCSEIHIHTLLSQASSYVIVHKTFPGSDQIPAQQLQLRCGIKSLIEKVSFFSNLRSSQCLVLISNDVSSTSCEYKLILNQRKTSAI